MHDAEEIRRCRSRLREGYLAAVAFAILLGGAAAAQDEAPTSRPDETRVLWKYAPAGARFADVVTRGGVVYALDRSGRIHALDAESGDKRWTSGGKEPLDFGYGLALSPDPGFDAILVGGDSGLFALDAGTGKRLWHTGVELGVAGPACTAEAVIAGGADGKVYACALATGKLLWQHDFLEDAPEDPPGFAGDQARFAGRPARPGTAATDGEMVVLPVFDQCRVVALDVTTGQRRWEFQTKGWVYGRPAIGPRDVVVASQDRHFYAVDKESGKLTWKVQTGARNEAPPAATERFVYFGSCDAHVYAVDQGRVGWRFATEHEEGQGAPIYSCPLVVGDRVYLAAMRGKVYALRRKTGELLWSAQPLAKSEPISDLVTDGERLFLATRKRGEEGEGAVLAMRAK